MSKLAYNHIWKPLNKKVQTLTIFDWDDTLFCTSALAPDIEKQTDRLRSYKFIQMFKSLDDKVVCNAFLNITNIYRVNS